MHRLNFTGFLSAFVAFLMFSCAATSRDEGASAKSPNGNISVAFSLQDGVPQYSITRGKQTVVKPSKLGFTFKDRAPLGTELKVIDVKRATFDETWTQPWGEVKDIRNHYNSIVVLLEEKKGDKRKFSIEFRVFDDGVGFRYEIPKQDKFADFTMTDELTEFNLAQDLKAWWIPAYGSEMDSEWLFKSNKVSELKEKMHTPLTMEGDSLYISIHEAALVDYASMTLEPKANLQLKCDLVPWSDGMKVIGQAPIKTPWRTIQIASTPGDLVTSYLILNLNEPNKLGDVSWIQPGKYNGIWWGMHIKTATWEAGPTHGATTKNVKRFIDFASKNNLSAVLIEGWNEGWEGDWTVDGNFNFTKAYPDYDIEELSRYAKEKNVGLIAHHETGGNVANYEKQMVDAFKLLQKYDIHRLKTGYVTKLINGKEKHQGQFMVNHYNKVMALAAEYKVMIDMHEPIKDTGLRRTYPNMMTREGARGTEYEAWSTGNPPEHTTILPFTRCLGGPLDYTPGIFDIMIENVPDFRVHTTLAKQLALYVVIYSPMHMAADLPEHYEGKPAFKFIQDVPTDWADTKVLNAKIGDYTTIARKDRNSEDWYIGSVTDESARTLHVKLDFLTPGKKYKAEIYADGAGADMESNPLPIEITSKDVDATMTLEIKLAPGGGQAIRFVSLP
ncbi:glycoside hydrolase family 97 protein [Pseudochryseolinea flava]|uniref:Glycoside hydrolase family 97 protein n=1 Tax=Pseudochryseolinea flava TaxID=2059302 RepID=A0A364Y431_9BACT|nr:glycoside hydrolase family 97 protein [Pseudochryseolinea flava]RAW00769.1 glycoside hydrolase family 97 protein [Pseudochryseolinea flava]